MPYEFPKYPGAIFTDTDYPDQTDRKEWIFAWLINALKEELQAALTELGTNPKGTYADVKARLDAISNFLKVVIDYMEYSSNELAQAAYVSSGGDSIKSNFETGDDNKSNIGDGGGIDFQQGDKFTIGTGFTCSGVSIYLKEVTGAPTGDLTLRIETNSGEDKPSGTLVHANATATILNGDIATANWNKTNFTPFTLAPGTYWLVCSVPTQANNNFWHWSRDDDGGGTHAYSTDGGSNWTLIANQSHYRRIYETELQCYSEPTIKQHGDYSLKGVAKQTNSLSDTLTRTVSPTIDLSGINTIAYDLRASRTGPNIKIGIHNSNGTTTETTPNVGAPSMWGTPQWDISGVADADKNAIDQIIITIINADNDNTFYLDNIIGKL